MKSSGIVLDKINAKIADSAKKNIFNVLENALSVSICQTVHRYIMLSTPSFNPNSFITSPVLPTEKTVRKCSSK